MVYDIRKDMDMARLDRQTSVTSAGGSSAAQNTTVDQSSPRLLGSESSQTPQDQRPPPNKKPKAKPWANLWKEKRQNNQDYLLMAEEGNM